MNKSPPTYRTDEQLEFILDETADWIVRDMDGFLTWPFASLRDALGRAEERTAAGESPRTVSRLSNERIVIRMTQIKRMICRVTDGASL